MARTRQEVRDFLNNLVGLMVNEKCGIYNGQCVSLIKALLEFLGAPNPYAARGDAKDVGDTLLRQGIASNSKGWLNVCVNRDMGVIGGIRYGHIWLDVAGELNIEQNGSRALRVTKGTRPLSQAQQIINLDQYIKPEGVVMDGNDANETFLTAYHRKPGGNEANQWVGMKPDKVAVSIKNQPEWLQQNHILLVAYPDAMNALADANTRIAKISAQIDALLQQDVIDKQQLQEAQNALIKANDQAAKASEAAAKAQAELEALQKQGLADQEVGNAFLRWLGEQLNKLLGKK